MNSKFDRYMRNEKVELTSSEKNGFNLFMGKAQCGTCHFAPLFNGTVPPNFDETEWEIIGTPENNTNTKLDEDKGRYNVAKMDIHQFAFKTPTIRNIEYTAPYMHNGAYKNLDEIVDFYNNGGGIGHGYHVPNQTLPSDSLKLSKVEMKDIVSFMNTLSDTVGLTKKPSRLPVVKVAGQIVSRKIGGEY
jgi:cytochrome c peroxidase